MSSTPPQTPHHHLPEWQQEYASLSKQRIELLIQQYFPTLPADLFSPLIISATSLGRSLKTSLALRYLDWERPRISNTFYEYLHVYKPSAHYKECYGHLLTDLAKIELIHSSSCILDDIIDGDTHRRGVPSFHVRESIPKALLTSLMMYSIANTYSTLKDSAFTCSLMKSLGEMLSGEALDCFPLENTQFILSKKSQQEIEELYALKSSSLFSLAHERVGWRMQLGEKETNALAHYGTNLGTLYQYANDYNDIFKISPNIRGSEEELITITLSLPLIIALSRNYKKYSSLVGKTLPRKEFSEVIESFKQDKIDKESKNIIDCLKKKVLESYPGSQQPTELISLLEQLIKPLFWEYSYEK